MDDRSDSGVGASADAAAMRSAIGPRPRKFNTNKDAWYRGSAGSLYRIPFTPAAADAAGLADPTADSAPVTAFAEDPGAWG